MKQNSAKIISQGIKMKQVKPILFHKTSNVATREFACRRVFTFITHVKGCLKTLKNSIVLKAQVINLI